MTQTENEIRIKHSDTEMTDWKEQLVMASELCPLQFSQHEILSPLLSIHKFWWMCVFGVVKLDQYFIVEYSFLGQEPWKFTTALSGSEDDPFYSISATKQTELLLPPLTEVIKPDIIHLISHW